MDATIGQSQIFKSMIDTIGQTYKISKVCFDTISVNPLI
jgi:hypothetical protein